LYRKKRRGVSTILGTIIFIGIMFTSVIPMWLVMKQADVLYERKKLELARTDEEGAREFVNVYVYPTGESAPDNLTVFVENKCELNVNFVRLWINDTMHPMESIVDSMSELNLGSYDVDPQNGSSFDVLVTTERGNVFEASSGTIIHDAMGWDVDEKFINVLIDYKGVVFKVYVTGPNNYSGETQVTKMSDGSGFAIFDITEPSNGEYNVVVKKGPKVIHDEDVLMEWPDGPSVIWVFA
jgi:hypothetical protein